MKGYKIILYAAVYINDIFIHNAFREVTIHAKSEEEAKGKVELHSSYKNRIDNIFITEEKIYSCVCLGTVRKVFHYEYH